MQTVRPCGCKGIRSCLICENEYNITKPNMKNELQKNESYIYCPHCNKSFPGWDINDYKKCFHCDKDSIDYPGVYIKLDFLSKDESESLMQALDKIPWERSQSGRRKQNFGPKCNFKSRKIRLGGFNGFPKVTQFIQERFKDIPLLQNFKTVEQCTLEYDSGRGASIDSHIDDCWIWGERVVTVNILGDSVLTMTPYQDAITRYNLDCVAQYPSVVQRHINKDVETKNIDNNIENKVTNGNIVVRLPMPARSLIILHGSARYQWEHSVLREDITERRVCLAYRELTPPYLENGEHYEMSAELLEQASNFW